MVSVVAAAPERLNDEPLTVIPRLALSETLLVLLPSVVPFSIVIESAVMLVGTVPKPVSLATNMRAW